MKPGDRESLSVPRIAHHALCECEEEKKKKQKHSAIAGRASREHKSDDQHLLTLETEVFG